MDTLTHALSGALLARAAAPGPGRLTPGVRAALGAVAAAFPDSDVVLRAVDTLTYLNLHRGVTHSLPLLPLWALALGYLAARLRRDAAHGFAYAVVVALGLLAHIAGDVITTYGTKLLAPFSDWRASWPVTFIIDPWFTAIIALGLLAAWRWRRRGRVVARLALLGLVAYVGFQGLLREQALSLARQQAAEQGWRAGAVHVLPQPLSPFHWKLIVEEGERYRVADVHLYRREPLAAGPRDGWLRRLAASYRPADALAWRTLERYGERCNRESVKRAWRHPVFEPFRRFAMFPVLDRVARQGRGACLWFADLRFAVEGRPIPFRFGLCREPGRPWRLAGPG